MEEIRRICEDQLLRIAPLYEMKILLKSSTNSIKSFALIRAR